MYQNIILIPYRDRQKHLDYFLQETVPLLHKNLPDSKVIIVEQLPGKLFNRGKLLNVGFKEFEEQTNYFITNDVDINPKEKTIQDLYASEIEERDLIRGIYNNKHGTLGGLIKIKHEHVFRVNGFPNDIWGWGSEDGALRVRTDIFKLRFQPHFLVTTKERDDQHFRCFNDQQERVKNNQKYNSKKYVKYAQTEQFLSMTEEEQKKFVSHSGLNNIDYKIIDRSQLGIFVERILVDI